MHRLRTSMNRSVMLSVSNRAMPHPIAQDALTANGPRLFVRSAGLIAACAPRKLANDHGITKPFAHRDRRVAPPTLACGDVGDDAAFASDACTCSDCEMI